MSSASPRLIAYVVSDSDDMPLSTAPLDRDWMDATTNRFAYRCLPLTIANQAGWFVANPTSFTATWDGGLQLDSVHLDFDAQPGVQVFTFGLAPTAQRDDRIMSHFGGGVLTFTIPYLFRTPPGINLWVKGPTNYFKDGIQPLEGIVETDWSPSTFTMNWKSTRPGLPIRFEKGEPICMVLPVPRGLTESLDPLQMPLEANPALDQEYQEWQLSRRQFNQDLRQQEPDAVRRGWQREYVKGILPSGAAAPEHQTRLSVKEFRRVDSPPE